MDKDFLKENNLKPLELSWWKQLLFKFCPKMIFKVMAKKMKIDNTAFDKLHDVFSKTEKIDIFSNMDNERGFILVLNRQTALYFYQNGNHFKYDGFEIGEYDKGDVTIFDHLKKNKDN